MSAFAEGSGGPAEALRAKAGKIGRLIDWKIASVVAGVVVLVHAPATILSAQTRVDFQRDVRPILSDNCFLCHGPDASTRKVNLRLDVHEEAMIPRRNGAPIVPGKPEQSLLYKKITEADPARRMPPISSHKTLSDAQNSHAQALDRAGRRVEAALGVCRARASGSAGCQGSEVGTQRPSIGSCWRRSRHRASRRTPKRIGVR